MIRASSRYLRHVVVLLALAAVPTWLHWTSSFDVDDCARPDAVWTIADGALPITTPGEDRRPRERILRAVSPDGRWAEGRIAIEGEEGALEFFAVRSFDAKRLYHWPEAVMNWSGGLSQRADRHLVETLDAGSVQLPLHRAHYDSFEAQTGKRWIVAYLLVYGDRPVDNPYLAQLLSAPAQLVRGRTPMWIFFVSGQVSPALQEAAERAARDWIRSAWTTYRAACRP